MGGSGLTVSGSSPLQTIPTAMEANSARLFSACFLIFIASSDASLLSISQLLGVHPLDEKYYAAEVIRCKDGSKSFPRDRLNDNFCDCVDGTDEPGTSACQAGKFYCRNVGSRPQFIFSSRVNDHICDCCDGSDEYDGRIRCPNTCVMGGNIEYRTESHISTISNLGSIDLKDSKSGVNFEDLIQKLKGLKIVIILQVVVVSFVVVFRIFHRRVRSKRRRNR